MSKMDLERRNYIPENYGEMYEDEIDLKEIFLILWRNKVKIMIIAFACMVIGFISGKIMGIKNKKSTVVVEYAYPGIEEGKAINGSTLGLTYNQFKNIFMIKDIFHKMPELEKDGLNEDDVLNGIKINPILPKDLKEGEVYYSNKFEYSLKIANSSKKDEEILKNFVEVQRDYFKRNYALTSRLPVIDYNKLGQYDYKEMLSVINNSINTAIQAIESLNKEFVSLDDKLEMQNMLKEFNLIKSINLAKERNKIDDYRLTKNPNQLLVNYRQQVEELERQKDKVIGKIAQLESMIKNYKPENKDIIVMSNGSSEKMNVNEENYYTEFIRQLANEKIRLSDIQAEIKYINKKMKQDMNIDSLKGMEINKELEIALNKYNAKVERINDLTVKNYNRKYSEIIKVIETVTTKSNSKAFLMTLVGLILGGFFGICYVLVGNFIFEEKKKKNNNQ